MTRSILTSARLVAGESTYVGWTFRAADQRAVFRVGSGKDCNWRVRAAGVSANHVMLEWDGRALSVLASGGGTVFVDGAPLPGRVIVLSGRIDFGAASILVDSRHGVGVHTPCDALGAAVGVGDQTLTPRIPRSEAQLTHQSTAVMRDVGASEPSGVTCGEAIVPMPGAQTATVLESDAHSLVSPWADPPAEEGTATTPATAVPNPKSASVVSQGPAPSVPRHLQRTVLAGAPPAAPPLASALAGPRHLQAPVLAGAPVAVPARSGARPKRNAAVFAAIDPKWVEALPALEGDPVRAAGSNFSLLADNSDEPASATPIDAAKRITNQRLQTPVPQQRPGPLAATRLALPEGPPASPRFELPPSPPATVREPKKAFGVPIRTWLLAAMAVGVCLGGLELIGPDRAVAAAAVEGATLGAEAAPSGDGGAGSLFDAGMATPAASAVAQTPAAPEPAQRLSNEPPERSAIGPDPLATAHCAHRKGRARKPCKPHTRERVAADLVAAGRFEEALPRYRALASDRPELAPFVELLEARQTRCAPDGPRSSSCMP